MPLCGARRARDAARLERTGLLVLLVGFFLGSGYVHVQSGLLIQRLLARVMRALYLAVLVDDDVLVLTLLHVIWSVLTRHNYTIVTTGATAGWATAGWVV